MTKPSVYFIESNFLINTPDGKILKPVIYPIRTFWQRIIVNITHFSKLMFVRRNSFIVAPWGLFWIPALYKFLGIKKFYILSLSTDTFLSKKTIDLRKQGFLSYLKYCLAKITYKYVDKYMYSSEVVKEQLQYFGVPEDKLGGKYDIWIMDKHRIQNRSQYDLPLQSNDFLFVGHYYLSHQKRLDILIEAFLRVREKSPNSKLHVVGAHWDKFFSKEKIREYEENNVIFYGFCYELDEVVKKCSFYVHPGEGEAIATSVLEAMLAGIVTIVSKEGGEREALNKVDKTYVVDLSVEAFAEKMEEVIQLKSSERKIIGERCRVVAKQYNQDNASKILNQAFLEIYNNYKG